MRQFIVRQLGLSSTIETTIVLMKMLFQITLASNELVDCLALGIDLAEEFLS